MSFRFNVRGLRTERVRADQAALAQVTTRLENLARDQAAADALLAEAKRAVDDIARETQELRDVERNMEKKLELSRAALVQECLSTLPDDVLRCIFLEVTSDGEPHAPFVLAAVCGRWRRVALDHASLWSDIHVIAPSRSLARGASRRICMASEYDRAKLLLKRSRSTPLRVIISADEFDGDVGSFHAFVNIVGLLGAQVSRWKTAALLLPRAIWRSALSFLKGPTPLLVSLRIAGPLATDSLGPDEGGYLPFAPRLESLAISDVRMGGSGRHPYPALATLILGKNACAEEHVYTYLRNCAHSVEKLVLGIQLSDDGGREALSFPRLRHLVIRRPSRAIVSTSASSLFTASALEHFEFNITGARHVEAIASFLDTVSSTVRKLSLTGLLSPMLNARTLSVFARLRLVEELEFRGTIPGFICNDALDLLTCSNPPIWPHLARIKNLRYSNSRGIWSGEAVFRFIASRNAPGDDDTESARTCKLVEFGIDNGSPAWLVAEVNRLLNI